MSSRIKLFSKRCNILIFIFVCGVVYLLCDLYATYQDSSFKYTRNKRNQTLLLMSETKSDLSFAQYKKSAVKHYLSNETVERKKEPNNVVRFGNSSSTIKIAVVLCGKRLEQTMVTLKSAAAFSHSLLHFVIFADEENRMQLREQLLDWPSSVLKRISFEIHPITFPKETEDQWKKVFRLCACQRLFLPKYLPHIDALLYVDNDVVFLRPVEEIWLYFSKMNSSHIAGLSPEGEDFATGWYNRFARHPYYEPLGVNSGVMLMNLTRMRSFHWDDYLQPIYQEYKLKIAWGDQDIINIIFHYHPEKLLIFPCHWNYRTDHCMHTSVCKSAEAEGVSILHGSRDTFIKDKQPAFKAIYETMKAYQLGTSLIKNFLDPLQYELEKTVSTNCGKLHSVITKAAETAAKELASAR